jgi:conjugal transfer/type IV secretion protein DotA/TraY
MVDTSSSMITPPGGDISVAMLKQLLGGTWMNLLNAADSGSAGIAGVLGGMFSAFNMALLTFVVVLLVWQTTMGAMQTAHEGVALGRRYHTIWAPVRAPLAIFFLTPLPMIKGLTILQAGAMAAVYMSIGVADTVWGGFTDYMGTHPQQVATSLQSPALTDAVPAQMLYTAVLKKVALDDGRTDNLWRYNYDGDGYSITVHMGVSTPAGGVVNTNYGQLNFQCGNPAPTVSWANAGQTIVNMFAGVTKVVTLGLDDPVGSSNDAIFKSSQCQARFKATTDMLDALDVIAGNLVSSQQGQGGVPTVAAMAAAELSYQVAMKSLLGDPKALQAQMDKQLTGFSNSAYQMGWVSTAFYYPAIISVINIQQKAIESVMPVVQSPSFNVKDLAKSTGISKEDLEPAYKAYIAYLNTTSAQNGASISGGSGDNGFLGGILQNIARDLQDGNLVSVMGSYGSSAISVGETLAVVMAGGSLAGAGLGALAGAAAGGGIASVPLAFAGGAIGAFLGQLGAIGMTIAGILIAEGAVMAYVIPFVPSVIILFAIVGWIVLVLEMFVALPLFAAAFAFAEGEGLAPPQTKHGIAVIGGILMRPTLIVFGFVFSFLLMNVGGHLLGLVFSVMFNSVDGGIGPVAFISLLGVLVVTVTSMVYFIARLITHLADHAPMWIGGNAGANLGVDNEAAGALRQGGQRGAAGAAAGAGYVGQAGAGMGKAGSKAAQEARKAKEGKGGGGSGGGDRGAGGGDGTVTTHQSAGVNAEIKPQKGNSVQGDGSV